MKFKFNVILPSVLQSNFQNIIHPIIDMCVGCLACPLCQIVLGVAKRVGAKISLEDIDRSL